MTAVIGHIVIDATDPLALARWWGEVLGWPVEHEEDEAWLDAPDGVAATGLLFEPVPEAKTVKNRLHLDVRPADGTDQAAELRRLLELGARKVDVGQGDVPWHVLADPEGNEFCLLRSTPSQLAGLTTASEG